MGHPCRKPINIKTLKNCTRLPSLNLATNLSDIDTTISFLFTPPLPPYHPLQQFLRHCQRFKGYRCKSDKHFYKRRTSVICFLIKQQILRPINLPKNGKNQIMGETSIQFLFCHIYATRPFRNCQHNFNQVHILHNNTLNL